MQFPMLKKILAPVLVGLVLVASWLVVPESRIVYEDQAGHVFTIAQDADAKRITAIADAAKAECSGGTQDVAWRATRVREGCLITPRIAWHLRTTIEARAAGPTNWIVCANWASNSSGHAFTSGDCGQTWFELLTGPQGTCTSTTPNAGLAQPGDTITVNDGVVATAHTTLSGNTVASGVVDTAGLGYFTAPTVILFGGGGTGATAHATISGGAVTAIIIDAAGSGYSSAPSARLNGGGGVIGVKLFVPVAGCWDGTAKVWKYLTITTQHDNPAIGSGAGPLGKGAQALAPTIKSATDRALQFSAGVKAFEIDGFILDGTNSPDNVMFVSTVTTGALSSHWTFKRNELRNAPCGSFELQSLSSFNVRENYTHDNGFGGCPVTTGPSTSAGHPYLLTLDLTDPDWANTGVTDFIVGNWFEKHGKSTGIGTDGEGFSNDSPCHDVSAPWKVAYPICYRRTVVVALNVFAYNDGCGVHMFQGGGLDVRNNLLYNDMQNQAGSGWDEVCAINTNKFSTGAGVTPVGSSKYNVINNVIVVIDTSHYGFLIKNSDNFTADGNDVFGGNAAICLTSNSLRTTCPGSRNVTGDPLLTTTTAPYGNDTAGGQTTRPTGMGAGAATGTALIAYEWPTDIFGNTRDITGLTTQNKGPF